MGRLGTECWGDEACAPPCLECFHGADHPWSRLDVEVVLPRDVPADDGREFFIAAWCMHPHFIPDEKIIFIPEPCVHNHVEAIQAELPGLCYLVRLRLVVFQDWNTPPASPDGGCNGGGADEDDGSYDSSFNRYHPGSRRPVARAISR